MDFTLIEKCVMGEICYKLLKANFYRNYFVIIAQTKKDFYCGSFASTLDEARELFYEITNTNTELYTIADILRDFGVQKI